MTDDPTLGEVSRRLGEQNAALRDLSSKLDTAFMPKDLMEARFAHLEERIETRSQAADAALAALEERLNVMQNWQQWAVRLIVGTLITVLITMALGALFRVGALG